MLDTPQSQAPNRRPIILAAIITATLVAVAAIAAGVYFLMRPDTTTPAEPGEFQVNGTMTVTDTDFYSEHGTEGEVCQTLGGGYDDLPNAQVVVTDAAGTVIATTNLDDGRYLPSPRGCQWRFLLTIPEGSTFYGIEVAHRGRLQYSREQLSKPLELTLN